MGSKTIFLYNIQIWAHFDNKKNNFYGLSITNKDENFANKQKTQ